MPRPDAGWPTRQATVIGLLVVNLIRPGAGFNVDPKTLDAGAVAAYARTAHEQTTTDFLLHIIPRTFTDAFTGSGDLLQVLLVAILFGYAMIHLGSAGDVVHRFIEDASRIFFTMMNTVMKLAPIGAGGAMAFTIGRYGVAALHPLLAWVVGLALGSASGLRSGGPADRVIQVINSVLLSVPSFWFGIIAILLPYTAESFPLRVRGRATGWVAACTKGGGVAAQALSITALVPAMGVTAGLIVVPTVLAFGLCAWFGRETKGRDLRLLDDALVG